MKIIRKPRTDVQKRLDIIEAFIKDTPKTAKEIVEHLGCEFDSVRKYINRMKTNGVKIRIADYVGPLQPMYTIGDLPDVPYKSMAKRRNCKREYYVAKLKQQNLGHLTLEQEFAEIAKMKAKDIVPFRDPMIFALFGMDYKPDQNLMV